MVKKEDRKILHITSIMRAWGGEGGHPNPSSITPAFCKVFGKVTLSAILICIYKLWSYICQENNEICMSSYYVELSNLSIERTFFTKVFSIKHRIFQFNQYLIQTAASSLVRQNKTKTKMKNKKAKQKQKYPPPNNNYNNNKKRLNILDIIT